MPLEAVIERAKNKTDDVVGLFSSVILGSNGRHCFYLRAAAYRETIIHPTVQFHPSVNQGLTSLNCCSAKKAIKDILCAGRFLSIQVMERVWAKANGPHQKTYPLIWLFKSWSFKREALFLGQGMSLTMTKVTIKTPDDGELNATNLV